MPTTDSFREWSERIKAGQLPDLDELLDRFAAGEFSAGDLAKLAALAAFDDKSRDALKDARFLEGSLIRANLYTRGENLTQDRLEKILSQARLQASKPAIPPRRPSRFFFHLPTILLGLGVLFVILLVALLVYFIPVR